MAKCKESNNVAYGMVGALLVDLQLLQAACY